MPYLFLTGPSGVGKSTILKEELAPWGSLVSGFFTQRQLSPSGDTLGFRLLPWEASLPGTAILNTPSDKLFIQPTPQGRIFRPEVFETLGIKLLFTQSPILCLDELGGGELLVPLFRQKLYQLLNSHPCCLGVLKSPASLSSMRSRVALAPWVEEELSRLYTFLGKKSDCKILSVSPDTREDTRRAVRAFIEAILFDQGKK